MSAMATMRSPPLTSAAALAAPMPPPPIIAMLSWRLGGTYLAPPSTERGTIIAPRPMVAACSTKVRRVIAAGLTGSVSGFVMWGVGRRSARVAQCRWLTAGPLRGRVQVCRYERRGRREADGPRRGADGRAARLEVVPAHRLLPDPPPLMARSRSAPGRRTDRARR